MANYANILAEITAAIYTNDNEEITGAVLQSVLLDMVDSLGTGYQYKGVATAETVPGIPDERVFYIAGYGSYPNFGEQVVIPKGYIGIFSYDGSWQLQTVAVGGDYDTVIATINTAITALQEALQATDDSLEDLGAACFDEDPEVIQTDIGSSFTLGSTQSDGSVDYSNAKRAFYRFHTTAPKISLTNVPSGWYVALHLCNSSWAIQENKGWQTGLTNLPTEGYEYIQLVLKYGSEGTADLTQLLPSFTCILSEIYPGGVYRPAAPLSRVNELEAVIDGATSTIPLDAFIQGTNDSSGAIVNNTTRIILQNLLDAPAGTSVDIKANGQKYVVLTYSDTGVYESSTGWQTTDDVYPFAQHKKLRFLCAYLDNSTITPGDRLVEITVTTSAGLVARVEALENKSEDTFANDRFNRWNKTILLYNPYKDRPVNAYKGQLHCHTTNSDGVDAPATVVQKYIDAGYDFMTITDHNYITPNPNVGDIVWMGESYEDTHNNAGFQHMNVYHADEVLGRVSMYETTNTPVTLVNHFVKDGDSVLSYNHPEYPPVYASDATLANLPSGISLVEVFNGTIQTLCGTVPSTADLPAQAYYHDMYDCTADGKRYINTSYTYASPRWQATTVADNPDGNLDRGFRIMLDNGHKVFCNAVDDYHRGDNMFNRGWVVAFAHERTADSIWNAILSGCSYASTGVALSDIQIQGGLFKITIANGENAVTKFYGKNNVVLSTSYGSTAGYQITGEESYVRAMVTIGSTKAWTQPVWIIGKKDQYSF